MNKAFRIAAWIFGILIALALVAPYLISSDFLKPRLVSEIGAMTGKKLEINGTLRLTFLPSLGVHASDVALSTPAVGTLAEEKIASVKSMDVQLNTFALLFHGDVAIEALKFNDAVINLRVDESGIRNWGYRGPIKDVAPPAAPKSDKKKKALKSDNMFVRSLYIENAVIDNATITYVDEGTGQRWNIEKLDAKLDLDGLSSPMEIEGEAVVNKSPVSFEVKVSTPHSLMEASSAKVDASIKSDLANGSFAGNVKGPIYTGNVALKSPSLKKLMAWLNGDASKASPKGPPLALDITGHLESTPISCNITKAKIDLDDIKANGWIKIAFDQGSLPQINIDMTTNTLDFTPYMNTAENTKAPGFMDAMAAENNGGWSTTQVDLSALTLVNGTANLRIEGAKLDDLIIGKGLVQAKLQRGRLGVDVIDTVMADGKVSVLSTLEANVGAITSRIILTDVRAEKLLKVFANYDNLSGITNGDISIATIGKSQKEWMSALQGNGSLRLNDGALKGFNIAEIVRNIKAAFKPTKQESQKTDFSELTGTFTITKGIVSNNDLVMKAPLMRLQGNGTVNLPERTLNYRLTPQIVDTLKGQGGADREGLGVPVIVQGSWDNPTFTPDFAGAAQDLIRNPDKIKDVVKSPKVKETTKKLKGLLKKL